MRSLVFLSLMLLLFSCSSTRFVDSWKNQTLAPAFHSDKMLVLAITDNLTARQIFEEELSKALLERGVNSEKSYGVLDGVQTGAQLSEPEIDRMAADLVSRGFDAAIITSVKGVERQHLHEPATVYVYPYYGRFGRYYFYYQDIYYGPPGYQEYDVYHVESALYRLDGKEDNALVWVGSFDITDPISIRATVEDYVKSLMTQMVNDGIIR